MTDLPHTQGGIPGRYHASGGHLNLARSGHFYIALIPRSYIIYIMRISYVAPHIEMSALCQIGIPSEYS